MASHGTRQHKFPASGAVAIESPRVMKQPDQVLRASMTPTIAHQAANTFIDCALKVRAQRREVGVGAISIGINLSNTVSNWKGTPVSRRCSPGRSRLP